jgi:hypothetical protein
LMASVPNLSQILSTASNDFSSFSR